MHIQTGERLRVRALLSGSPVSRDGRRMDMRDHVDLGSNETPGCFEPSHHFPWIPVRSADVSFGGVDFRCMLQPLKGSASGRGFPFGRGSSQLERDPAIAATRKRRRLFRRNWVVVRVRCRGISEIWKSNEAETKYPVVQSEV